MITGDNPRTAATIAREAGVDDFVAEAKPEDKIAFIRTQQADGHLVAMTGDGTNDAPALAQSDVGPRHEQWDLGGQGGRQHGRPRLRSDEAARGHRDRQAAAHHARLDHDVLDLERRGQVLRDPAGDVRRRLPGAECAQRHGPRVAAERDPVSGDLQRADHRRADPAGPARRRLPAGAGQRAAAAQPAHLRPRRDHRPVHRDQADRRGRGQPSTSHRTHQ